MRPVILLHLFYPDIAIELIDRLAMLDGSLDIIVTTPQPLADPVQSALDRLPNRWEIVTVPNRGWDIGPLFAALPAIVAGGYDLVCKLHTKKGGSGYAGEWRDIFLESLVGSDVIVGRIVDAFEADERLELAGPASLYMSAAQNQFSNRDRLARLAPAVAAPKLAPSDWGFFAGTMFWARRTMLERLAPLAEFHDTEADGNDGALAHAVERLFGLAPYARGGRIGLIWPDQPGDRAIEIVAAPSGGSHDPIINTLVAKAEEFADAITPALAGLIDARNPLVDYIRHGRDADALDPNPYFSSTWYNRINADVFAASMHPLAHYLHHGAFEDRSTGPLFDMGFYMKNNPEIAAGRLDPLRHFIETGLAQGQSAIPISQPQHDVVEDGALDRFYRAFDLERERAFLDHLQLLPGSMKDAAAATPISIVMPAWDREESIGRAIQSVIDQTHEHWELWVVDDGSTDETIAAIEPFLGDPRIRLIRGDHAGVSAARNAGLAAATGDLIAYLDSDNQWKPWFLERMALFLASEDLEAAYCALELRDDLGQLTGYHGADFDWAACFERNYVDLNAFCHRRQLFEQLGGFDPKLRRMVDWDLILRYGKGRRIGYAPFVGVDYHDGSADRARITVAEPLGFLKLVRARHEEGAAERPVALSFAIKIAAPEAEKQTWGDYHFADSLKIAIQRLGHIAHVDFRDRWHVRPPAEEDVVIVLRGLIPYDPRPGQITLLWNISHPDQVGYDEMERFSRVFVASRSAAEWLGLFLSVEVSPLLQATDPERFHPGAADPHAPELLFCGNSRGVERPIVRWAIESGHPPAIIGDGWVGTAAEPYVVARVIDNRALGASYAGADFVLNDHWPSMAAFGFVSNRLFDIVAAGGRALSDRIAGIAPLFGDRVAEVSGPADIADALAADQPAREDNVPARIAAENSFDARAAELVGAAQKVLGLSPVAAPAVSGTARLRVHAIVPYGPHGPQSSAFVRLAAPLTDESVNQRMAFSMGRAGAPLPPCDIVIVQRAAMPTVDAVNALMLAAGQQGASLLTDVDDAFLLLGDDHPETELYAPLNAALDRVIAASAETWFSTHPLRAAYARRFHRSAVIGNALDPRIWRDWRTPPRTILTGDGVRFLYMGTHTHGADFASIRPALERLAHTHAGRFEVTIIGVAPDIAPAPWLKRLSPPAGDIIYPRFVRWLRAQGPFDAGLAPLVDTPFNRAKSDVKLLDYAALGLLPIASDVPSYRADRVGADRALLVGEGADDWHAALGRVIEDRSGLAGRAAALSNHLWAARSVAGVAVAMADRLESLTRR